MRSTYHRPCGVPGAAGRRRRTAAFAFASSLVAMLAGALVAVPGASARPAARAAAAQTLVIEGTGNGHGVGMSQDGALGYARHGLAYQQILAHYYTGTTLGTVSPKTVVKVLVGSKVKRIAIERYVRGVVAAEMPSSWPAAALQAQAVASRTYALTAHAGGSRFDVYADTRSQVFRGAAAETPATNAAAAATVGQIVLYGGRPAITYFFAASGGMTESVQYGFPGAAPAPWLVGVTDGYEGGSARWRLEVSFPTLARRLRGLYGGRFHGVEVLRRGTSPRILTARVLGTAAASVISGPALAARLGLDSTWEYLYVRSGSTLKPEPDHSGRPRLFGPLSPSSPAPPPPPSNSGGVPPAPAGGSASARGTGGGTPAGG
ncbi:MAG TPA: SpoIID/LytB domain-containing protein [Solirubrobacteraceae bacterium]